MDALGQGVVGTLLRHQAVDEAGIRVRCVGPVQQAAPAHRAQGAAEEPGVFYAKDAFEGLSIMDRIVVPEERIDPSIQVHGAASHVL